MKRTNIKQFILSFILLILCFFAFGKNVMALNYVNSGPGEKVSIKHEPIAPATFLKISKGAEYVESFSQYCSETSNECSFNLTIKKNAPVGLERIIAIDDSNGKRFHMIYIVSPVPSSTSGEDEVPPAKFPTPSPSAERVYFWTVQKGAKSEFALSETFANVSNLKTSGSACQNVGYNNGNGKITINSGVAGACMVNLNATNNGTNIYVTVNITVTDTAGGSGGSGGSSGSGGSGGGRNPMSYQPVPATSQNFTGIEDPIDGLCETYTVHKQGLYTSFSTPKGETANLYRYTATDTCTGEEYISICIDPTRTSPTDTTLYRKVAPVNPLDDIDAFWFGGSLSRAYEAFVLSIVQQYYDDIVGNADTEVGAQLAFRVYFANIGQSNGKKMYYDLARAWSGEDASYSWSGGSSAVYSKGKELYDYGKQAGDACYLSGNCSVNITDVGLVLGEFEKADCDIEGDQITKYLEGPISGLDTYDEGMILTKFIGCEGFECELEIDGASYKEGSTLPHGGSTYKFKVTASSSVWANLKPSDLVKEIGFEVEASSKKDFHNVIAIKPITGNIQRMVLIRKAVPSKLQFIVGKLSDLSCGGCYMDPELKPGDPLFNEERFKGECCDDPKLTPGDKEAYCPIDEELCANALWAPVCDDSEEGSQYFFYEGLNMSEGGKIDYENCVIDKKDEADNTYNMHGFEGNPYCTVSCKEDWEFDLPGKKYATAGRYFLLSIPRIQGVRTCVTSLVIKNDYEDGSDTFEQDLKRWVEDATNAYNTIMRLNAYIYDYKITQEQEKREACEWTNRCEFTVASGTMHDSVKIKVTSGGTEFSQAKVSQAKYDSKTGKIDVQLEVEQVPGTTESMTYGYINRLDKVGCGVNSCDFEKKSHEEEYAEYNYEAQVAAAIGQYNAAIDNIKRGLDYIKQCSNWENEFHWEPEVRYTYAESYYMDLVNGNNLFDIEAVEAEAEVPNHQGKNGNTYCTGEAKNDDYECLTHDQYETSQEHDLDIFHVTNPGELQVGGSFNVDFVVDTKLGSEKVPYNTSIMQVRGHAQENIKIKGVWYTLHDTGDMMYDSAEGGTSSTTETLMDEEGSPNTPNGDRTGKVMPVRITTPAGTYEYQIMFTGVGQYNDDDATGRVIGGTNGKGAKSVFTALTSTYNLSQTYLCHYEVKETLCTCCGDDIEYEIVSLLVCPSGDCGNLPSGYQYENGNLAFFTRAISVNDMNPNDRTLGSNWTNEKGEATKAAIESKGEYAYEEPEYSYTITSQGLASLKGSNSNYASFNLICNDEGMDCTSPFLDELETMKGITVNAFPSDDERFVHYSDGTSWK